jgi:hypothetical protein
MLPHNYVGIKEEYEEFKEIAERILNSNNPITFPKEDVDVLQVGSKLEKTLDIAIKNLSKDSSKIPDYIAWLKDVQKLNTGLSNFVKENFN